MRRFEKSTLPFFIRWSERTTPSLLSQYSDWEHHHHFFLSFICFSSFVDSTSHTENNNAMRHNEWTFSHGAIKMYFTKNARTNEIELPRPKHDCTLSSFFNIPCNLPFFPFHTLTITIIWMYFFSLFKASILLHSHSSSSSSSHFTHIVYEANWCC